MDFQQALKQAEADGDDVAAQSMRDAMSEQASQLQREERDELRDWMYKIDLPYIRECKDINECVINNGGCDPRSTCTNTEGGFRCGPCPNGYTGCEHKSRRAPMLLCFDCCD